MNIKELFKGVAVVIDDKINDAGDLITKIINKLEKKKVPVLKYEDIPENKIINNLNNVAFILLDWELFDRNLQGTDIAQQLTDRNFRFIRKLRKISFVPIFIFSNEDPDIIKRSLSDKNLYQENGNNHIFVKRKQDLFTRNGSFKLYNEIKKWLKQTPSIYVLKEWEKSLNDAKAKLFWDFYDINHKWPSVLQKTFINDGSDVDYELGNFIFKNIMARTEPIKFDEEILKLEDDALTKDEIRHVLEAERFLKQDTLPDLPFTGDLFKKSKDGKNYLINIRPDCDIIRKDNPSLYLIEGKEIDENLINSVKEEDKRKKIVFENGFIEKEYVFYVPFVNEGKIIEFDLKKLTIKKWNDVKNNRIGRLLHPYITKLQQKYSFYLQRQGLPAIPEKAIKDD